eukprot:2474503-Prymnesium_polylepis.1
MRTRLVPPMHHVRVLQLYVHAGARCKFNHDGNTPPGQHSGASWEGYDPKRCSIRLAVSNKKSI